MQDVLNFFNRVLPILQALVVGGIIKSNSGIVIANLIADIEGVIKGAQNPSTALIGQVEALLNDLKIGGILQGQFIDALDSDLVQFGTFTKAIQSQPIGQPGIGPKEKLLGVEGSWVFIPDSAEPAVKAPLGL